MNEVHVADDLTFDKVERYYLSSGKLSPKEKEICERWELAFSLFAEQRSKKMAVQKYIGVLKQRGKNISEVQAYRDFTAAEKLFTPIHKYNKEFLKLVIIESALKDVAKAEELAKETKDTKSWVQIMDVKNKAEKRIIEAAGLTLNDPNLPDFGKLQANQFNINVDRKTLDMFRMMMKRGVVDVTELYNNMQNGTEEAIVLED